MSQSARSYLAASFSIIVWATTYVSSKILLRSFTAPEVTFLRLIIAYAALCLFSLIAALWQRSAAAANFSSADVPAAGAGRLRQEGWFMLAGLTGVTAYFLLQNTGMTYTTATNTSIILNTIPVLTALLSWVLLKDRSGIHPLFFLGFLLAMAGIAIISFDGQAAGFHLKGDLLILVTALDWSFYTLIHKKLPADGRSILQITRRIYFWGLLWSVPFMIGYRFHPDLRRVLQPVNLLNLLFLGIVACAVCFITWNYALERIGALKANILIYAEPIISVASSALILHEVITARLLLGIVLSFLGVILSGLPQRTGAGIVKK